MSERAADSAVRVLMLLRIIDRGYLYEAEAEGEGSLMVLNGLARDGLAHRHPASYAGGFSIGAFWTATEDGQRLALDTLRKHAAREGVEADG